MLIIIRKNQNIKSQLRWVNRIWVILIASMLSACSTAKMDHSICDLQILSLQLPKQSEVAVQGDLRALQDLKKSQEKFNRALVVVLKKNVNHTATEKMLKDGDEINANIDLILKHKDSIIALQDLNINILETMIGIQAEYNLLTDQMAQANYPSAQVVIAKNQVFVADRISRSIQKISKSDKYLADNIEDFLSDLETFNMYLQGQLEGNADLGVERVKDAEMREILQSIQISYGNILEHHAALDLLKKRDPLIAVNQAVIRTSVKSDEIFNDLNKLELNTQ